MLFRYWVTASGIAVSRGGSSAPFATAPIVFHVNSGSTLSYLPTAVFNSVRSAFPEATPQQGTNRYTVPCALADEQGSVDFSFGGTVINVPLADFIWRQSDVCFLGVAPSGMSFLGF